jgi:hypothetical protein
MSRSFAAAVLAALALSGPRAVLAEGAVGSEFLVNTYTSFGQSRPAIAMNGTGFVVAWDGFDGSSVGIRAQRFSSGGAPLGTELVVSTYTFQHQGGASVAQDAAGNFVIVWTSSANNQDGDQAGVFGQRYDASGNRIGGEFQVNSFTPSNQSYPSVARRTSGEFMVTWDSWYQDGHGGGVYAQRFDAAGSPLGGEFLVNATTLGWQSGSSIAVDGAGNFVVAWSSGYGVVNVMGQRFDGNGARLGGEFQVNTTTASVYSGYADVAAHGGQFVVSWRHPEATDSRGVRARVFQSNGTPLGPDFQVNTWMTAYQNFPQVTMDATGFVVIWQGEGGHDGDLAGVFAQRFAGNGTALGSEFQVNTYTTSEQRQPDVAAYAGRFVAVWDGLHPLDGHLGGVVGQRYDFDADRTDGKVLDFHADAMSDLLWYNSSTGQAFLWKMNGGTAVAFSSIGTIALDWSIVAGGDFGGDGRADLVWYNKTTGQTYLWQMNGATPVTTTPIALVGDLDWQLQATGDTDGDGKADMIWQNQSTGAVYVWRMNGSTMLSTLPVATVGDLDWRIAGARDMNGDGRADLIWRNRSTGQVYVWQMNGASYTPLFVTTVDDLAWKIVAGGDFTADGKSDLIWYNTTTGKVYLWTMNGAAILDSQCITTVPDLEWRLVGSGDFNANGRADLLWHHRSTGQTYVWLMNGLTIQTVSLVSTVPDPNWAPLALH